MLDDVSISVRNPRQTSSLIRISPTTASITRLYGKLLNLAGWSINGLHWPFLGGPKKNFLLRNEQFSDLRWHLRLILSSASAAQLLTT